MTPLELHALAKKHAEFLFNDDSFRLLTNMDAIGDSDQAQIQNLLDAMLLAFGGELLQSLASDADAQSETLVAQGYYGRGAAWTDMACLLLDLTEKA